MLLFTKSLIIVTQHTDYRKQRTSCGYRSHGQQQNGREHGNRYRCRRHCETTVFRTIRERLHGGVGDETSDRSRNKDRARVFTSTLTVSVSSSFRHNPTAAVAPCALLRCGRLSSNIVRLTCQQTMTLYSTAYYGLRRPFENIPMR